MPWGLRNFLWHLWYLLYSSTKLKDTPRIHDIWKKQSGNLKLPPRRVLTGRPELLPKISQQAISIADCKSKCHSLIFVNSIRIRNLAPSHRDVPSAHSPWRHWEWSVMWDLFQEAWAPVPESKTPGFSFLKNLSFYLQASPHPSCIWGKIVWSKRHNLVEYMFVCKVSTQPQCENIFLQLFVHFVCWWWWWWRVKCGAHHEAQMMT